MRTKNSMINLITAVIGQALGIIISFISRKIFIQYLGSEYLGIDGLFTNILTMLSLVELGVGSALTFSLYKPLADNNVPKIKSLMKLYKIAYRVAGITIIVLGLCMLPFYRKLIETVPDIPNLDVIFLMFVFNTAISYFYSYKRSLIICDQKRYIATIYRYSFYFLLNVAQIVMLILTKNYILFLICQICSTLFENIMVSIKANKMYPYIKEKNIEKLEKEEYDKIRKNVFAMLFHKVGATVVNSTDNILMSKFVGIISVGLYSNYYMITNALVLVTNQIFEAIVASVGNLGTTKDNKKMKSVFNNTFLLNFWVFGLLSTTMAIVFNDFISIWVGKEYTFQIGIVYSIVICFYLRGIRKSCLTFRDALGIFWYDRHKPIFECLINLVSSIILAKKLGVLGIFLGTIISTITTSLWVEPYILYKYGFKDKVIDYFKRFIIYTGSALIAFALMFVSCEFIEGISIVKFILKGLICVVIFNVIFITCYFKTEEFQYYVKLTKKVIDKVIKKTIRREKNGKKEGEKF